LVFDDEPDKAYQAKVYENIDIEEIAAYGNLWLHSNVNLLPNLIEYRQVNIPSITTKPYEITIKCRWYIRRQVV